MKTEEIIEMAKQAGMGFNQSLAEFSTPLCDGVEIEELERFAKLVAAKEREACIAIAESKRHAPNFALTSMPRQNGTAVEIANQIRARGEA